MFTALLLKLRGWIYGVAAAIALLLAAWLLGRQKGRQVGAAQAQAAREEAANAQAIATQLESRHDTDIQIAKLPDAPAQRVAEAAPGTAAGELRDRGWLRD